MSISRHLAALAAVLVFGLAAAPQSAIDGAADLPDGPGKDAVVGICSKCHGIDQFSASRHNKEEWNTLLDKMAEEGLELSDQQYETVVDYLSKFLSKDAPPARINVNRLLAPVLEKEADAIVRHRTRNGPFKNWQEVAKVPGVDAKKIEALKDLLQF
jgi:competence protein ComEA